MAEGKIAGKVAGGLSVVLAVGALIAIPNDVVGLRDLMFGDGPAEAGAAPVSGAPPGETVPVTSTTATTEAEDAPARATEDRPAGDVVEEPADTPPAVTTKAAPRPTRGGPLVMQIRMGSSGRIGPAEYRAGSRPGAHVAGFDDYGQQSAGCYPSWSLTRDGTEIQKVRNGRCTSGGITMFNFGDSLDAPGTYRLSVSVVTDGGRTGSSSVDFLVT